MNLHFGFNIILFNLNLAITTYTFEGAFRTITSFKLIFFIQSGATHISSGGKMNLKKIE